MAREELALKTQLLLQEVSHLTQQSAASDADVSLVDGNAPVVSELEAARMALLDKLKKKKETRRAQMQQVNQRRYGFGGGQAATSSSNKATAPRLTPVKGKAAFKLPVASSTAAVSHKKKDMLAKLRQQAIQQGSENMAKLFGYTSYEEQIKKLNMFEVKKILEDEKKQEGDKHADDLAEEQDVQAKSVDENNGVDDNTFDFSDAHEEDDDADEGSAAPDSAVLVASDDTSDRHEAPQKPGAHVPQPPSELAKLSNGSVIDEDMQPLGARLTRPGDRVGSTSPPSASKTVRRRHRIEVEDEDDGNEADSEQDGVDDAEDEDDDMTGSKPVEGSGAKDAAGSPGSKKDRAAVFRELLRAEAKESRRRKRLVKGGGVGFVESEAEEDEEEDVLKIGGLGDFGFGVPQAKTQESKEAEEERNALKLRDDDLEHIVDDLSDDEQAQQQDLDEIFRKEQEEQDRDQVKEVMRNVKEGFGRNRRAFSSGLNMGEARGRFNLDQLVAADGDKFEAARLGLLESDEELSDGEDKKKTKDGDEDEEDNEEEDEEAEMERLLRERYTNQPKIYVTSSESESEDEPTAADAKEGVDEEEANSDEERERQQMKLFSEKARINRRMQRMKDIQRQMSTDSQEGESATSKVDASAMPNVLLEEDEDSQELLKLLNRTDVNAPAAAGAVGPSTGTAGSSQRAPAYRPKLGRFNSFGVMGASRSSSSFTRVVGNCKMFGSSSGGQSKGFVFTALSSDRLDQGDENATPGVTPDGDEAMPSSMPELSKSKSWSQSSRPATKRSAESSASSGNKKKAKRGSNFLSVLSSYQCVTQTNSEPL